ncbi:serine-rich protein [Fusarium pseudocircinatum]|uniref:Serine-rich protein n=1 Tax=Fusarium pseudocircinatum TaxID=56676 RepID=A0A8H5PL12_9HYPO|nr:serine-rich protein [Fusarium pseudocircinatum]
MILDHRQLPVVSTLDLAMSTPGQGTQPTGASAPNPSSVDNNSNVNPASSPAENSSPAQPATSNPASNNSPSATQPSPSADETQPATNDASQASDNASASETAAPAPTSDNASPSSDNPAPSPTSSSRSTQARPTTEAADPSSTDDNNDRQSTTEESEASATEITTSEVLSTIVTVTGSQGPETSIVLVTAIRTQRVTATEASASATSTDDADAVGSGSGNGGGGLSQKSKVAIGVAVPIAAIAILALLGLFWWKKRKTRRQAEEERRKEVEDYAYNPNADPTIPAVGMADGGYEMREDGSSGYRGWGNTTLGSTGRKASTTLSGGVTGAYSDITSPTRGNMSDGRSGEPLMDGSHSPEGEILGAMGPSAANNRGADVHRGPSNASSSYSAAGRSDASDPMGVPYGAGNGYYDQYSQNPYNDNGPQQAVIRDNPARRNTRIENPSHYPQQSAGISQNF